MPEYEIEQYELYTQKYVVEAEDEVKAICKFIAGEGEPVDADFEYIEVAECYGMPADEYPGLCRALAEQQYPIRDIVPGIRSIRKLKTPEEK